MNVNFAAGRAAPHEPSPFPVQHVSQRKPFDRMYKIVLHSLDADAQTSTGHIFREVNIPFDEIKGNCRIFVSSFYFVSETNAPTYPYKILIDEIAQPLSYDTNTKGNSKALLTLSGQFFENGNPDFGVSVQDLSLFRTRTLTVSIDAGEFASTPALPEDWILTLGII